MRIVLDTNILLVSLARKSKFRIIFDKLLANKFSLIISNEILLEYQEIIEQKTNSIVATNISELLLSLNNVHKQDIYFNWETISIDKDDNKFVDCAISGNADYIVTNDKHFNVLKNMRFPSIKILNIEEFINLLTK